MLLAGHDQISFGGASPMEKRYILYIINHHIILYLYAHAI